MEVWKVADGNVRHLLFWLGNSCGQRFFGDRTGSAAVIPRGARIRPPIRAASFV
ncbi:hypothetical protein AZA_89799 [Nitrospirillum viridazoti Y2]|nr:hypothetical protein AZA_89799 [Nitrospirillum amazonense Y2]